MAHETEAPRAPAQSTAPALSRRELAAGALAAAAGAMIAATPAAAQMPTAQAARRGDTAPSPLLDKLPQVMPGIEAQIARNLAVFDVPGCMVGIVSGDKLVYSKAFGTRSKSDKRPVDARTVFQIGSTTKAFLATTMAIAVDQGRVKWDDRIADLNPDFALKDNWATREFRLFDIIAQRSGLMPYANDGLTALGYPPPDLVRSLRYVEPISSFRSSFAYTNITHLVAGHVIAKAHGAKDWDAVAQAEILDPLGMKDTTFTAEAISAAPNHAVGHTWATKGSVEIPFDPSFPYSLGPAGNMNSTLEDMTRWMRLHLANGAFEGKEIVSPANLGVTRLPRVGMADTMAYAMGWLLMSTPNGRVIWHNGGTNGFGTHFGFLPDKGLGVIVLSNLQNIGFVDALAISIYNALLGNPAEDLFAREIEKAKAGAAADDARYTPPKTPTPPLDPAALAGTYSSPMLGEVKVEADGKGLTARFVKTGAVLTLAPFDGALYLVRLKAEGRFAPIVAMSADAPTGFMSFTPDAEGKLSRMTWLYDDMQSYVLTRG
ncbi:serine hydrolase [Xanthobacteraceae bacterium A53D]